MLSQQCSCRNGPTAPHVFSSTTGLLQGQPQLVEPLPALFACVRRLAALQGPPVGGSEGMAELEAQLMERDSAAAMQVGPTLLDKLCLT
jgi:hypothetical protein